MSSDNGNLPVDFSEPEAKAIEIKARRRAGESLVRAKTFERFGMKVIKVKSKAAAELGKHVDTLGIKNLGHGKILMAGDYAHEAIEKLAEIVDDLRHQSPACDPEAIVQLMQLQRDFNRQLLETGQAHLVADRHANASSEVQKINIPFPPGTPMVVAIGKPPNQIDGNT